MTQPQTLELVIDSMTAKGDGVARHDGRTIYVRGALPGETVQVVLEDEKPRYAQGRLLNVVQADADRVTNFCPHQQCGGCQLGHLAYPAQLVRKQQLVEAALAKHQLAYPVQPCLGMETPFAYRNKVLYAVQPGADGAELGFYQINSHALVACDDCAVQPALVPELVAEVRAWEGRPGQARPGQLGRSGLYRWARCAPAEHGPTLDRHHDLVALVDGFPARLHQTHMGLALHGAAVEHGHAGAQCVTYQHRFVPFQRIQPGRAQAAGVEDEAVAHHAHDDAGGVPAAGGQSAEQRGLACLFVQVEGLRVEIGGKADDLLAADFAWAEGHAQSGCEIFPVPAR